jgi:hypothetical protein
VTRIFIDASRSPRPHDGNSEQGDAEQWDVDRRGAVPGGGDRPAAEAVHHQRDQLGGQQRHGRPVQRDRQARELQDHEAAEQEPDGDGGDHDHRRDVAGKLHLWPVVAALDLPHCWPMPSCSHDGFHSGEGRYEPKTATLRYVIVCEACRQEMREVLVERYTPSYNADGNAPYAAA